MIDSLALFFIVLAVGEDQEEVDVYADFADRSVEIQLEITRNGVDDEYWLERLPRQGSPGDADWHRGGNGGHQGRDEGMTESSADGRSLFYCMGGIVGANPACMDFVQALPTLGTMTGCFLGRRISDTPLPPNAAPRELCIDDLPGPEAEQALVDESVTDVESEWEQIITQIPGEVERAFASLPIEGGQVLFEPELLGFGYINRHTNVFVDIESQTFTEMLLGIEVEIRAMPVEYRFDYGDGTARTVHDPGGPAAELDNIDQAGTLADTETRTSHAYGETGVYPVEVTTTFIGEYQLPGGAWMPVNGSTEVSASPGEADIWRIDHRHVAEECRETGHWGCSGPVELGPGDRPPAVFADHYDESGRYLGP